MTSTIALSEIEALAPMPASLARLASVVGNPDAGAGDVANVIEFDQALTANLLRMANSAWSSSRTPIVTVRDAVLRLGAARILELAVGHCISPALQRACDGYELAEHELWRHSVAAALAAERLSHFALQPIPGAAFTAALLHDVGKLIVNRHVEHGDVTRMRELAREKGLAYLEAEREVLGTDHAEVGAAVARHWGLPEPLVDAIERHHDPDAAPGPVQDTVHIANAVAKLIGVGLGSEQMNMKVSAEATARLGLSAVGLESLCATVKDELAKTEELWGTERNGD